MPLMRALCAPEMNETFPASYDEALAELKEKGSIAINFEETNKRRLKAAIDRNNKLEDIRFVKPAILRTVLHYTYGIYILLLDEIFAPRDKGFHHALLIYRTLWRHISSIGGESLADGQARITFYART